MQFQEIVKMADSSQYPICKWEASYYNEDQREWLYGELLVSQTALRFVAPADAKLNKSLTEAYLKLISYGVITEIKKLTSSFVYSCVTVFTGKQQHWFSSLPKRGNVFNVVMHFWRNTLIPEVKVTGGEIQKPTTLGQKMLQVAADSEKTLQSAGEQLQIQGEQLDHATGVMYDLHSDLDVAEHLMSGLESWMGRWKMPKQPIPIEPLEIINARAVPKVTEVSVIYSNSVARNEQTDVKNGSVRILKEGVTIIDDKGIPVFHYCPKDISLIKVISPWEIVISKYQIGEPDITYIFISSNMMEIIQALEPGYRQKIQYEDPPDFAVFNAGPNAEFATSCQGTDAKVETQEPTVSGTP